MKPMPKAPPSRLCHECRQAVHAHKDSIFVVQDGEKRLYHNGCYQTWRKNTIKQLRKEAKGEDRKRLATPCVSCTRRQTRIFTGSYDAPHIRVCADGHYQMERPTEEGGRVAITEYAAAVWKSNSYAWAGQPLTAQVMCTACMESIMRAEGMQHVLEKHAVIIIEDEPPPPEEVPVQVAQQEIAVVEETPDLHTQQKGVSDLSLDDLLVELASRISVRITNLEQATAQSNKVTLDLKALVEQLLRGWRP